MDRELRNVVAGIEAARLAPDLLAEAIGIDELVGADRNRVEPVEQAEVGKLFDRMRERIDANAKLADRIRLLENLTIDPARMQYQPGHEATDAAASDDYFHDATPYTRWAYSFSLLQRATKWCAAEPGSRNSRDCRDPGSAVHHFVPH